MIDPFPDDETLYAALVARDAAFDGRAYVGVKTTGVFCRLTCPARKPKRVNTVFFARVDDAIAAGFRPCLRCRPSAERAEDTALVTELVYRIGGDKRWTERNITAAGFDPSTVRRAFRRRFGATFLAMDRRCRVARGVAALTAGGRIIDGQLEAGFESSSGFRAAVTRMARRAPCVARPSGAHDGPPQTIGSPASSSAGDTEMRNQVAKAGQFFASHVRGDPLTLVNVWDAGSAGAVERAGAAAIATSSWSMAAAQGYADGERIPIDLVARIVGRIVAAVDLPVTVDIEGGYAATVDGVADNIQHFLKLGVVGINIEDGVVGSDPPAICDVEYQCGRIRAIRAMSNRIDAPLFINARTDLFLQTSPSDHASLIQAAIERSSAYEAAGADGIFVPGLIDERLIQHVCASVGLPINVMMIEGAPSRQRLASVGVARISHGPAPYRAVMAELTRLAEKTGDE